MIDNDVARLVVVNSGLIMGIITAKDMAKTIVEFKERVPEKYQHTQIRNLFVFYFFFHGTSILCFKALGTLSSALYTLNVNH